jgi:hypothetical protein
MSKVRRTHMHPAQYASFIDALPSQQTPDQNLLGNLGNDLEIHRNEFTSTFGSLTRVI